VITKIDRRSGMDRRSGVERRAAFRWLKSSPPKVCGGNHRARCSIAYTVYIISLDQAMILKDFWEGVRMFLHSNISVIHGIVNGGMGIAIGSYS
jgi:hypothetical protein